jgi:hypothetical protein
MKKNVGLTYGEFEFPAEQGFTGSRAKGYKRGGAVKKMGEGGKFGKPGDKYPTLKSGPAGKQGKSLPKNVKKHGGEVHANMGGFMGPEREITVDDVSITTPRAKGGYMKGGMHGKLKRAGAKMGYKYGGQVKKYGASGDTSGEFKMKKGKQDTMDDGVQPARRGKNARNQAEAEAGGTGRLKPGLSHGGHIKGAASSGGGALADAAIKHAKKVLHGKHKLKAPQSAGTAASKKGMPKNVKMAGGMVHKARGGSVKK